MNHYLVYKNPANALEGHIEITGEEFYRITRENNLLPKSQQRIFIRYDALDEQDNSRMYWEATREERNCWRRSERVFKRNNTSLYADRRFACLDDMTDEDVVSQMERSTYALPVDTAAESAIFVEQLMETVSGHEDWTDMVSLYIRDMKHKCGSMLASKFDKCEKTVRNSQDRLKKVLEEFAADWK